MIKTNLLTTIIINLSLSVNAQVYSTDQVYGIFQNMEDTTLFNAFTKKKEHIVFLNSKYGYDPVVSIGSFGFLKMEEATLDSPLNSEFLDEGSPDQHKFYAGNDYVFYFDLDPATSKVHFMELQNTNVFYFTRIKSLPKSLLESLIEVGKSDDRNYIEEFLDIDYWLVSKPKATIFLEPNKPSKRYLVKGDKVELLDEKKGWVQIRYYGSKLIEGWLRKEDINRGQ